MMPPITREIGFRGRTIWAQAKWPKRKYKKTDTERIIKYNLNLWGIELKDMGLWGDDFFVTRLFVLIDFHEWLHLFIYHIGADGEGNASDICEAFICEATDEFMRVLELTYPDPRQINSWFKEFENQEKSP